MNRILGTLLLTSTVLGLSAPNASAQDLDDAAIAHIAVTANQLDIDGADQALEKSRNAAVRAFAETMARDHQGVIEQAAALAGRLGVTPKDNEHSRAFSLQAAQVRDRLAGLEGAAFDRAYMDNEVAYHQAVIGAVEGTLIPNTSNPELKSLLQSVVPALQAHLEHARRVSQELRGPDTHTVESQELRSPATHTVEIRDMAFHPTELTVRAGDTIVWINRDIVPHTATGLDSAWTSPQLAQGLRWSTVASGPDAGRYTCAFHPVMRGRLLVDSSPSSEMIP